MGYRELVLVLLLVSGLVGLPSLQSVLADTLYVPAQYPTIQAAIDAALPGDTILVSSGSYNERLIIYKEVHLVGEARASTFIDAQGSGTPVYINATNVEITRFTLGNGDPTGKAIFVSQANGVKIIDNTIAVTLEGDGVNLDRSNNTSILDNVFNGNLYAINVTRSELNRIEGNRMLNSNVIGLQLLFSDRNTVHNNTFTNGEEGIDIISSRQNNVSRNLIRGMSFAGLFLLDFPTDNRFFENTLQINHIGVNLQNATGNSFYHNNILASEFRQVNHVVPSDLALNVWDNRSLGGAVWGGNYWDDYVGVDDGSNGRVAGDGIGDTTLPASTVDQYPLMVAFVPIPLAVVGIIATPSAGPAPLVVSLTVRVLGTSKPFTYLWDFGDGSPQSTSEVETHTYDRPGNYSVRVRVEDATGTVEVTTEIIAVSEVVTGQLPFTWIVIAGAVVAVIAVSGVLLWRRRRRAAQPSKTK